MAQLEVASTAGTWVAAFSALLALGVFVGPFLIWRASQTERHKALDRLEKGEAENGGFISKGLRVSPTIRLFRRVRVPDLEKEPQLTGWTFSWNQQYQLVPPSSGSWVQFCVLLKACKIGMNLGGSLEIREGKTWLPLHKNWILILGIAGRFAIRSDKGKIPRKLEGRAKSSPGMPGRGEKRLSFASSRKGNLWKIDTSPRRERLVDEAGDVLNPLFGTFGTLLTMNDASHSSRYKVYYHHHTTEESGSPSLDTLGIQSLFWLAVGCLPLANGDLYSLENCVIDHRIEEKKGTNVGGRPTLNIHGVHFGDSSSSSSSSDEHGRTATTYTIPARKKRDQGHNSPGNPIVFRFSGVKETVEELAKVASSLESPDQPGMVYSLEEIDVPEEVLRELKDSLGSTYHPISNGYVRLGEDNQVLPLFLERSSAQRLAKGLLDLALSPEGYLIGASRDSWCRGILCNSAQLLPHLVTRICNDINHLNVPDGSKSAFIGICEELLEMCVNYKPTRAFFRTIASLDKSIEELLPLDPKAMAAVGVVAITSAEFRDFLTHAVRVIQESTDKLVTLDMGPVSTLNVPSVMGVIQKYPIDMTDLFPRENITIEAVSIRFHHMIFAALKACLRSTALETSLDSTPLFEAFWGMSEVVYMG